MEKGLMSTGIIIRISILCAFSQLAGCATNPGGNNDLSAKADDLAIAAPDPEQVHYIAWVPREQAQTAAVAKALTHIALGNARERTGEELCGGNWLFNRKVTGRVEPIPAWSPASSGSYPAWYYRISHQPGFHGCASRPATQLYRKMQANLPAWIAITPATQESSDGDNIKETLTLLE